MDVQGNGSTRQLWKDHSAMQIEDFLYVFSASESERDGCKSLKNTAGTTRLELATSAVIGPLADVTDQYQTVSADAFDATRYRMSPLIVPLLYADLAELLNFSDPISE
jgi:hypothetical protein